MFWSVTISIVKTEKNTFRLYREVTMDKTSYEKPQVISYSEDEILDIIGPAQTCNSPVGTTGG